jgi:hypothetical protein
MPDLDLKRHILEHEAEELAKSKVNIEESYDGNMIKVNFNS